MTPSELARLHAAAFSRPPPWSQAAFAALLTDPSVTLLADDARAFLLGRHVADEAEILTLATHPDARRRGLARALVRQFLAAARERGAASVHLEVAEDNAAARALYAACGFAEAGRRPGYYRDAAGRAVAALLLSRHLPA